MVKLKVDNRDVTEEEAASAGGFADSPKPGLYRFRVEELNEGWSKNEEGKPDKSRPYIEGVLKCADKDYAGAMVWTYFLQPGHPSYNKKDKAKFDQFLRAIGFLSDKKRTGEFDSDKHAVGKYITVQIRAGKNQDGTYRGEYSKAFPDGHEGVSGGDDETLEDEGLLEEGDEELLDDEASASDWDARREELEAAQVGDLKPIAKEYGITLAGHKKASLIDAILEYEQSLGDEDDESLEDDDELLDDEEEVLEEEASGPYLTREELGAMETAELIKTAKDFDLVTKGKKKSQVIDEIITAQAAPGDVDEDGELPF